MAGKIVFFSFFSLSLFILYIFSFSFQFFYIILFHNRMSVCIRECFISFANEGVNKCTSAEISHCLVSGLDKLLSSVRKKSIQLSIMLEDLRFCSRFLRQILGVVDVALIGVLT